MDGKEVIKRLKAAGFELESVTGSHHYLRSPEGWKVTVAVHGKKDIPIGTLKNIERRTGLILRRKS